MPVPLAGHGFCTTSFSGGGRSTMEMGGVACKKRRRGGGEEGRGREGRETVDFEKALIFSAVFSWPASVLSVVGRSCEEPAVFDIGIGIDSVWLVFIAFRLTWPRRKARGGNRTGRGLGSVGHGVCSLYKFWSV